MMHGFRAVSKALSGWQGRFEDFITQLDEDGVPYLSFSKIAAVESCQQSFFLQYIEQVEVEEPGYFKKGRVFHEAASMVHRQMGQDGLDLKLVRKLIKRHFYEEDAGHLLNAVQMLIDNAHQGYEVVATELPFVLSLGKGLPPLIGVIDLLLRKSSEYLLVDHKTGKDLYQQDAFQLSLYREHVRRAFTPRRIKACYDEYRWVNNLDRIRKPAFRRTHVTFKRWPSIMKRVKRAATVMKDIQKTGKASGNGECFKCHLKNVCPKASFEWQGWY